MLIPFPSVERPLSGILDSLTALDDVGALAWPGGPGGGDPEAVHAALAEHGDAGDQLVAILADHAALVGAPLPTASPAGLGFDELLERLEGELGDAWPLVEAVGERPLRVTATEQTHLASLQGGQVVELRVRLAGATDDLRRDLQLLGRLRASLQRDDDQAADSTLRRGLRIIERARVASLDLRNTARSAERLATSLRQSDDVSVAAPTWPLVAPGALATERVAGDQVANLRPGFSEEQAESLLLSFLFQVLVTGVVHPDPAPDAVSVDRSGDLQLSAPSHLLFLDDRVRAALMAYLSGALLADADAATEGAIRAGASLDADGRPAVALMERLDALGAARLDGQVLGMAAFIEPLVAATAGPDHGPRVELMELAAAARSLDSSLWALDPELSVAPYLEGVSEGAADCWPSGASPAPEPAAGTEAFMGGPGGARGRLRAAFDRREQLGRLARRWLTRR